jgi:ubiquinone/menaquinone biosynthesis C-methylase UbiE
MLGALAGVVMATRPSNRWRSEWTVDLLDIRPTDQVLEVGFGPGVALRAAARRVSTGHVTGVDRSAVMLGQARRRNRRAVAEGRVELLLGGLDAVSAPPGGFDKVFAVNVFMFWSDPVAELRRIAGLTAPGGVVALTLQSRARNATPEDTRQTGRRIAAAMEEAGLRDIAVNTLPLRPVDAVCVTARV